MLRVEQPWLLIAQEGSSRGDLVASGSVGLSGSQAGQHLEEGHFSEDGVFRAGKVFSACGTTGVCTELTWVCLTFWDCPPSALSQCSPVVHSVLVLFPGSGVSGRGAARAEELWRCSACIEWLNIWIKALLIQGDTGEQWQQTSTLLCLAGSPLPSRTELLPAHTPPPKFSDTTQRCLMGPTGDVGPCLRAQYWVCGEK